MSSYYIDLESMDDMRVDHYCVDHETYWKIKIMLDEGIKAKGCEDA